MEQKSEQSLSSKSILLSLLVFAGLGGLIYFGWPLFTEINDPKQVESWIIEAGVWGPAIYILLQIVQVLIAPIPGQFMALVGGYLFGPWMGLFYTMIGSILGSALIFVLARKLGRPFVERFVRPHLLQKFDHLTKEKGPFVFFLMFLLPAFPDDILSFVAGLTTIPIRTLILISLVGRLPGYAVLCFTGHGMMDENLNPILITLSATALVYIYVWSKRAWLRKFAEHPNRRAFLKETWHFKKVEIILTACAVVVLAILMYQLATVIPLYSSNSNG